MFIPKKKNKPSPKIDSKLPLWVYLTCYQALSSNGEADLAKQSLQAGDVILQQRAAQIQDEQLRRQFLENVPFNRELLAAISLKLER